LSSLSPTPALAIAGSERSDRHMSLEFLLSGLAAVLVLVYLVYALLRPERF